MRWLLLHLPEMPEINWNSVGNFIFDTLMPRLVGVWILAIMLSIGACAWVGLVNGNAQQADTLAVAAMIVFLGPMVVALIFAFILLAVVLIIHGAS